MLCLIFFLSFLGKLVQTNLFEFSSDCQQHKIFGTSTLPSDLGRPLDGRATNEKKSRIQNRHRFIVSTKYCHFGFQNQRRTRIDATNRRGSSRSGRFRFEFFKVIMLTSGQLIHFRFNPKSAVVLLV